MIRVFLRNPLEWICSICVVVTLTALEIDDRTSVEVWGSVIAIPALIAGAIMLFAFIRMLWRMGGGTILPTRGKSGRYSVPQSRGLSPEDQQAENFRIAEQNGAPGYKGYKKNQR